jgi:hypothetical protein
MRVTVSQFLLLKWLDAAGPQEIVQLLGTREGDARVLAQLELLELRGGKIAVSELGRQFASEAIRVSEDPGEF